MNPRQDQPKTTPAGSPVRPLIAGLNLLRLPPRADHRGEIVELFRTDWGYHPDAMVHSYAVFCNPGSLRAWVVHKFQDDRIAHLTGKLLWGFYDNRPDSPTYKMLNTMTFTERDRVLFTIPCGVYHGVKNIGGTEAVFINHPTRAYDHANPDKYRLPVRNDLIPFDFENLSSDG